GVLLAHGSPRDPVWEYLESGDQGPQNFAAFDQHLALVGHTHKPRIFTNRPSTSSSEVTVPVSDQAVSIDGERMIINPGGVGQPRDGNPLAAFGIYQPDEARFTFYRVPYEIETTQQKMRQARLPEPLVQRLAFGL
ncbi:MAG: metallophosphoesterase family protein, partial [Terriglobales bacterium]